MSSRQRRGLRRYLFRQQRYHQGPTPLSKPSREQRRQTQTRQSNTLRWFISAVVVVILAGLTYKYGFVRQVQVEGLDPQATEEAKQLAQQYLRRSWYGSFKPLVDTQSLTDSIEVADSRFSGTVGRISWFNDQLLVETTIRHPVVRWQATDDQRIYLVDDDGVVYIDDDVLKQSTDLPLIEDSSRLELIPGKKLASTNTLNFVRLVDRQLIERNLFDGQNKRYVLAEAPREVQLAISAVPYRIKFITDRSASDQVQELATLLTYLKSHGPQPAKYIDLRVDDTAYYR